MPRVMAGRRMCHARQATLRYQVFVCFLPQRDRIAVWGPVGIRSFVTPFRKTRHNLRMRFGTAEGLHSSLAFPHRQGPECAPGVDEKSPPRKPRCAHNLALRKKGLPHECRKIPHRANTKTGDGSEHSLFILAGANLRLQVESQLLRRY